MSETAFREARAVKAPHFKKILCTVDTPGRRLLHGRVRHNHGRDTWITRLLPLASLYINAYTMLPGLALQPRLIQLEAEECNRHKSRSRCKASIGLSTLTAYHFLKFTNAALRCLDWALPTCSLGAFQRSTNSQSAECCHASWSCDRIGRRTPNIRGSQGLKP